MPGTPAVCSGCTELRLKRPPSRCPSSLAVSGDPSLHGQLGCLR